MPALSGVPLRRDVIYIATADEEAALTQHVQQAADANRFGGQILARERCAGGGA